MFQREGHVHQQHSGPKVIGLGWSPDFDFSESVLESFAFNFL